MTESSENPPPEHRTNLQFSLSSDEFKSARRYCQFLRIGKWDAIAIYAIALIILNGIIAVLVLIALLNPFGEITHNPVEHLVNAAQFVAIDAIILFAVYRSLIARVRTPIKADTVVHLAISDHGIVLNIPGTPVFEQGWSAFTAFEESGEWWLLLLPRDYLPIPRRYIPAEIIESLRKFLHQALAIRRTPLQPNSFPIETNPASTIPPIDPSSFQEKASAFPVNMDPPDNNGQTH